jgi:hypothetical protein
MLAALSRRNAFNISVWQALQSYKGSAAQQHLHDYVRDNSALKMVKQGIDYKTINKNSKGRFMIR